MDREELIRLLENYEDDTLSVSVNGHLVDDGINHWDLSYVEQAIDDLKADIANLRAVIEWAKQAPKYEPAEQTTG